MALRQGIVIIAAILLQTCSALASLPLSGPREGSHVASRQHAAGADDAVKRALSRFVLERRDDTILSNSTTFAKTFDNAVLYEDTFERDVRGGGSVSESIQITCSTCYIKGTASIDVTTSGNLNLTQALHSVVGSVGSFVENVTDAAINDIVNITKTEVGDFVTTGNIDVDELHIPTLNYSFNANVQGIAECHLHFGFDELELYMLLDTTLTTGGSYHLRLYRSESEIGIAVGDELELGVLFTIDLLIDVEDELDMSNGFHIKLDNGAAININLFDTNVSSIAIQGGKFEFLPVTLNNGTSTMTATLRLGVHAGVQLATPGFSIADIPVMKFSTGLEIGVFADLAEFTTTFNESLTNNSTTCDFMGEQTYQLALGADAGATLALGNHTWGPAPTSTMPLFYTTLSSACLGHKHTSTSPPAMIVPASPSPLSKRRKDDSASSTTTTLTSKVTYTAVQCPTGSPLCPVSQQTTSLATRTSTLVTVVPSGSEATFPPTTVAAVSTTIPFGRNAQSIFSSSGSPVSYVPPPPPTSTAPGGGPGGGGGVDGVFGIGAGGMSQTQKIIIGVTVGIGVPLLAGLIAGIIFYSRKRRASRTAIPYAAVQSPGVGYGAEWTAGDTSPISPKKQKAPRVSTREIRR